MHGVMNAVYVVGNMLGDSMYYGSGAGSLPTASAVVGDLVSMAKEHDKASDIRWSHDTIRLADPDEQSYRNFIRTSLSESGIRECFEIESVLDLGIAGEIGVVTASMTEKAYKEACGRLSDGDIISRIRIG